MVPGGMKSLTIIALALGCSRAVAGGGTFEIVGADGYLPPTYVVPVPPAVKITRGANASGLDIISSSGQGIGGEYMQRWIAIEPLGKRTVGYINNGGYAYLRGAVISDHTTDRYSDINMRMLSPRDGSELAVWGDGGPDDAVIAARTNEPRGPLWVGMDYDGTETSRVDALGTVSLKPQTTDAPTLTGFGRIYAKGDGLYWRAPSGAVRRLDVE